MIWLHIVGAFLCWLAALGTFGIFFLLLDECWHRGRLELRIEHEAVATVVFAVVTGMLIWAGIALLPDKESWKVVAAPVSPCASSPR